MDRVRGRAGRLTVLAAAAVVASAAAGSAQGPPAGALALVGVGPADLAVGAPVDWLGHVTPATVPWLLPHHREVLGDPPQAIVLADNLGGLAALGTRSLGHAVTVFLLHPRLPGFRGLPVPVPVVAAGSGGLTAALADLAVGAGHAPVDLVPPVLLRPLPPSGDEEGLPAELRAPVADLLAGLAAAARWVDRSWQVVPGEILAAAVADSEVARRLAGGDRWWPALDRAARGGDDVSRAFAAVVVATAADRAAEALVAGGVSWEGRWDVETPRGRVVVAGTGDDLHRCDRPTLAVVDLGGHDRYEGACGAGLAGGAAVSVVVDLAGDDRYVQGGSPAGVGAGLGGIGVVVDVAGDDRYVGGTSAQGWGLLGYGVVDDRGGDDLYRAVSAAQGGALFGGGLLLDRSGDDRYTVHGEGQGFGGTAGAGVLADLSGDDRYLAEPDPAVAGRADPHVDGRAAASNAQGAGVGRRGDVTDGHLWAGGLGALLDVSGDDVYRAGTFAQGSGYQLGTGVLVDASGDDRYRAVYFAHGAGSHGGVGVVLDGAGADLHLLEDGAGHGYGWSMAVGIAVDRGGDDVWIAARTALGRADRRSFGMLLEEDGCDLYDVPADADVLGAVDHNPGRRLPAPLRPAAAGSAQHGLFLDLGGRDVYPAGAAGWAGDRCWVWADGGGGWLGRNVGAGCDLEWTPVAGPPDPRVGGDS